MLTLQCLLCFLWDKSTARVTVSWLRDPVKGPMDGAPSGCLVLSRGWRQRFSSGPRQRREHPRSTPGLHINPL